MTDTTDPIETPRAPRPRATAALSLAAALQHASPGDQSALRRGGAGAHAAFYKLAAGSLADVLPRDEGARVIAERDWALVAQIFAQLGPALLVPSASFGRALSAARVAEMRVLRLLRAEGDDLAPLLRHAAHQLGSRAQPVCPTQVADLVLSTDSDGSERIRRRIARDYFAAERAAG